jgi:hypothetical protein
LTARGAFADAEPLLLKSWPRFESNRKLPPAVRSRSLERLITLYDAWGKPEQAGAWRAKRLDLAFPAEPFAAVSSPP